MMWDQENRDEEVFEKKEELRIKREKEINII